jgi:hypothetical protein
MTSSVRRSGDIKDRSAEARPRRRTASERSAGDWNSRGTASGEREGLAGETEMSRSGLRTIRGGARKKQTSSPEVASVSYHIRSGTKC